MPPGAFYSWIFSQPKDPADIRSDWAAFLMAQMVFGGNHLTRMFYGVFMILVVFVAPRGIAGELVKRLKSIIVKEISFYAPRSIKIVLFFDEIPLVLLLREYQKIVCFQKDAETMYVFAKLLL